MANTLDQLMTPGSLKNNFTREEQVNLFIFYYLIITIEYLNFQESRNYNGTNSTQIFA